MRPRFDLSRRVERASARPDTFHAHLIGADYFVPNPSTNVGQAPRFPFSRPPDRCCFVAVNVPYCHPCTLELISSLTLKSFVTTSLLAIGPCKSRGEALPR